MPYVLFYGKFLPCHFYTLPFSFTSFLLFVSRFFFLFSFLFASILSNSTRYRCVQDFTVILVFTREPHVVQFIHFRARKKKGALENELRREQRRKKKRRRENAAENCLRFFSSEPFSLYSFSF